MTRPPDPHLIMLVPAVVLTAAALATVVWLAAHAIRYLMADKAMRPMPRLAWRIRHTWPRTARRVGLVQVERTRPPWWSNRPPGTIVTRELIPAVTVTAERFGARVDASTVGRLGLVAFTDAAGHLADLWRVLLVRAEQVRPGLVRLRALLVDPLTNPTPWTGQAAGPAGPMVWAAGIDADGRPVTIRSSGVSGVVVAGLAGYGKTSFLNARFCQLAPRIRRCSSCSSTARAARTTTTCSPARGCTPKTPRSWCAITWSRCGS